VHSKIFVATRETVTTDWRTLHNTALPDIIRTLPLRRRWAGHVARIEEEINSYGFGPKPPKETSHLQYPGVDVRVILQRAFQKWVWWVMV
jgi:hypothetical protein